MQTGEFEHNSKSPSSTAVCMKVSENKNSAVHDSSIGLALPYLFFPPSFLQMILNVDSSPIRSFNPYTQLTMKHLQTVAVLVTILTFGHAFQTEYFIKPNESTRCPALLPCHTLSYYLEDTTRYFTSNTRFSFLHGIHEINKSGLLLIQNVFSLTLTGYRMTDLNAAKIMCMQPATLKFNNITNLMINHLSVLYCGYPVLQFVNGKELSSAAVYFLNIISLKLSNISVENSTGYGVVGVNVLGNSSISHSRFLFNNYYTLNSTNCSYGFGSCKGGNMYFLYETLPESATLNTNSVMSIDSCVQKWCRFSRKIKWVEYNFIYCS